MQMGLNPLLFQILLGDADRQWIAVTEMIRANVNKCYYEASTGRVVVFFLYREVTIQSTFI